MKFGLNLFGNAVSQERSLTGALQHARLGYENLLRKNSSTDCSMHSSPAERRVRIERTKAAGRDPYSSRAQPDPARPIGPSILQERARLRSAEKLAGVAELNVALKVE
jgi:hypothetical protein